MGSAGWIATDRKGAREVKAIVAPSKPQSPMIGDGGTVIREIPSKDVNTHSHITDIRFEKY